MKKWLWEHENYPNYTYDKSALKDSLEQISKLENELNESFKALGILEQKELIASSVCNELISSFKIEGISLDEKALLENIKAELSQSKNNQNSPYARLAYLALNARFDREVVDARRMLGWHSLLFSRGAYEFGRVAVGEFRHNPVYVGSHKNDELVVEYEAPPAQRCATLVAELLARLANMDENIYIKSALAHFAFVLIHPYDDGNGRSTRLLADYFSNAKFKLISHSPVIFMRQKEYYAMLKSTQSLNRANAMDITEWIAWHLKISIEALKTALADVKKLGK